MSGGDWCCQGEIGDVRRRLVMLGGDWCCQEGIGVVRR